MLPIFNEDEKRYQLVEEPDPSLSYTYSGYLHWKFKERLELIKGRIYKMSLAPGPKHQKLSVTIPSSLFQFLKRNKCQDFPAPFDVRLSPKNRKINSEISTVLQPDICGVCEETKIDDRGCFGAPDLVVEILSPGNSAHEVKTKFELYQQGGVKEYWLIKPAEENAVVFIMSNEGRLDGLKMVAAGDILVSQAMPGFSLPVNEIFTN